MRELEHVVIHIGIACLASPGPVGYGIVLLHGEKRRELSGGYRQTTGGRAAIQALIEGLQALRYPCAVTVYTDSTYLVNGITRGWASSWRANGWRRAAGRNAPDVELWERLLELYDGHHIRLEKPRDPAHRREGQRCHRLAVLATREGDLPADEGYRPPDPVSVTGTLPLDWE